MEPNTRVTSSQLRFEWNAWGQSSFLRKSWADFVFSSNNLRFRWNVKNWHFSPWSMWKFHCWCEKLRHSWVFPGMETPHIIPGCPKIGKLVLSLLSDVHLCRRASSEAHAAIRCRSLHSPSLQQLWSYVTSSTLILGNIQVYCNRIRFGTGTPGWQQCQR